MIYGPAKVDNLFSQELAARLSRQYTEECVERLAEIMRDKTNPGTSLAATNALLDRAYGKPKEIQQLSGPNGEGLAKYKVEIEFIDVLDHDTIKREQADNFVDIPNASDEDL